MNNNPHCGACSQGQYTWDWCHCSCHFRWTTGIVALFFLVALPVLGLGQEVIRFDVGASISASRNFGYQNPNIGIAGHIVGRKNRFGFEGTGTYLFKADKIGTTNGKGFEASALGRFYFNRLFVSGGLRAAYQSTSTYSKSTAGPQAGIGYDDGKTTVQALYDHEFSENHSYGLTFIGEHLIPLSERTLVSIRPFVTVARFTAAHTTGMPRETGTRGGAVVGFGWGKR